MKTETAKFKLTFTEPTLATSPGNREILSEFKASKAPDAEKRQEELDALPAEAQIEKASTVFPRNKDGACLCWDYQLKGFFKEAIAALVELGECGISKWQVKKAVDQFLFVGPRQIVFHDAQGSPCAGPVEVMERPLRASTLQGDRIALARSEMLPPGTTFEFSVTCMITTNPKAAIARIDLDLVRACLERGKFVGYSQWRGGGFGRFTFEEKGM